MSPTSLATKAFYNATFCDSYVYGGTAIFAMQDQNIEVEHTRQRVVKVLTSSIVGITKDANGVEQLPYQEITHGTDVFDIISWQYHGNFREEIILVIEGDSRGN